MRERNVFNVLLTLCIALGFVCFAFILLPEKLEEAKVSAPASKLPRPLPLRAIAEMDSVDKVLPIHEDAVAVRVMPLPLTVPEGPSPAMAPEDSGRSEDGYPSHGVDLKVHPASSLALHEPSVLDSPKGRKRLIWIFTPEGFEADAAFWRDVYAKYDRDKTVFHHPKHLNIVYDVVDTSDISANPRLTDIEKEHLAEKRVEERRDEITEALLKLSTAPQAGQLSEEEYRIKKLFPRDSTPDIFRRAANEFGVRAQTGQRDRFAAGLKISGRYLGEVEKIFGEYGLPRELTRIVFVESMFDTDAKSSSGASGIWQFMPATGRLYLKINSLVDERDDPIAATHAAAKLLRQNYDELGSWPLAINAYNTGRGRMAQAVKLLGTTDIGQIIKNFNHPSYAFASRNFYIEFLAALDVAEHADDYFKGLTFDEPIRYETVTAGRHYILPEAAGLSNIGMNDVERLNPHLTGAVLEGQRLVPAGFSVRVPEGAGKTFAASAFRAPRSRTGSLKHVVSAGESLTSIAEMYGVSVKSLRDSNRGVGFYPPKGQVVVVP